MKSLQSKAFIAYGEQDRSSAEALARSLRQLDVEPILHDEITHFLSVESMADTDTIYHQFENLLSECSSCFIILSPVSASLLSRFAYQELEAVERYLKNISFFAVFPVFVDNISPEVTSKLPDFIREKRWTHFSDLVHNDQVLKDMLSGIDTASVQETENTAETQQQTNPKSLRTTRTIQLPEIDWVEIPAGTFIYGEKPAEQTLTLERFFISRYPITNCQYQTFIDAGGYQDEQWWHELIKPAPKKQPGEV
jgi:hypothetical protein